MSQIVFYPLRFEPIYQYRLWGGRRLADLLTVPLPDYGPFGEAWLLSDRKDHQSRARPLRRLLRDGRQPDRRGAA